jgi:hypothetical protein
VPSGYQANRHLPEKISPRARIPASLALIASKKQKTPGVPENAGRLNFPGGDPACSIRLSCSATRQGVPRFFKTA